MKLNQLLAGLTGSTDEAGEWLYFITIFGNPSDGQPWGWQLEDHHLNLHCVIVGDQLVMTPTFVGSAPTVALDGPCAGTRCSSPRRTPGQLPEGRSVFIDGERSS